ncbi:hypothetical protein ACEQ8H_005536 [Pleosporales sp. CAS-2024a]
MDGTNSAGRKVSLLNDLEPQPPHHLVRLHSLAPSLRSRTSSYDSSAAGSPPTPQLVRTNSSDSTAMQTPSPITPDFAFPSASDSADYPHTSFFPQQKDALYPHMYDMQAALPYHPAHHHYQQQPPPPPQHHQQPPTLDGVAASAAAQANGRPKKNQYPCPMAKQIGCKDHFTTSGHAARHAKKHTGKKDAICPECNKAFTRKDNMEQHRRTHQSGRGAAKPSDRDAKKSKARTQAPRPKPSPLQSQPTTPPPMPTMNPVDPSLGNSPTASFIPVMQPSESFADYNHRSYPDPTAYAINAHSYMTSSSYGGLDALASAASREQQLDDESEDDHSHQLKRRRQS